jgi:hypothetical protein
VKVRKALCAAAGVYPWAFLGQTCDVFGTLQSVPCRAHQRAPAPETGRRIHAQLFIESGLSRAAGNVGSGDLGAGGRQQTPSRTDWPRTGIGRIMRGTQITAQKVVRWLGAPSAARPCPTLRRPPNHIVPSPLLSGAECALAPMAAGAVSGRWATAQTCSNSHRRPTVPDQFSRWLPRRHSAWCSGCLRRASCWEVGWRRRNGSGVCCRLDGPSH